MKHIFHAVLVAVLSMLLTACGASESNTYGSTVDNAPSPAQRQEEISNSAESNTLEEAALETPTASAEENVITLTVGNQTFSATLLDNETTRQLTAQFPLTLDMSELNGNEKYFYIDGTLPMDSHQPGQINAGDLMLYGNNCLVLFYKTFSSGYSYTRLGSVDDPAGLSEALGTSSVMVEFSIED